MAKVLSYHMQWKIITIEIYGISAYIEIEKPNRESQKRNTLVRYPRTQNSLPYRVSIKAGCSEKEKYDIIRPFMQGLTYPPRIAKRQGCCSQPYMYNNTEESLMQKKNKYRSFRLKF